MLSSACMIAPKITRNGLPDVAKQQGSASRRPSTPPNPSPHLRVRFRIPRCRVAGTRGMQTRAKLRRILGRLPPAPSAVLLALVALPGPAAAAEGAAQHYGKISDSDTGCWAVRLWPSFLIMIDGAGAPTREVVLRTPTGKQLCLGHPQRSMRPRCARPTPVAGSSAAPRDPASARSPPAPGASAAPARTSGTPPARCPVSPPHRQGRVHRHRDGR